MAVHFNDDPALNSRGERIDGTTDGTITAVRVVYDEEIVYTQDGGLHPAYAQSEVGGTSFDVARTGGWQRPFTTYVEESQAAPSTLWEVVYDKDLRTLPNQFVTGEINDVLEFTADGQPWFLSGTSGSLDIVNGVGMVIETNGIVSGGLPYGGCHVNLKVYEMDEVDLTKEIAVQVRYAGLVVNSATAGASVWCSNSEAWGNVGDDAAIIRWGNPSVFSALSLETNMAQSNVGVIDEDNNTFVFAVSQLPRGNTDAENADGKHNYRAGYFKRGQDPDVWPSMESMVPNGGSTGRGDIPTSMPKMGFYAGSPSGTRQIIATHIRVLQRAVT